MMEPFVSIARGVMWLIAFFWVLGALPIGMRYRAASEGREYSQRRDLTYAAILVVWMFAGYALFRWLIPEPVNPFFDA